MLKNSVDFRCSTQAFRSSERSIAVCLQPVLQSSEPTVRAECLTFTDRREFVSRSHINSPSQKIFRSAFTLLEVMLVMAILVVLGSIAVPILDSVMERQKLRGSAEELRLAWEGARLKAMRTGQAEVFQCEVDSGNYTLQPLVLHDDVNNVGMGATLMSGGVAVQTANTNFGLTVSAADPQQFTPTKLDEAISFVSCRVASDSRAFSMAQTGGTAGVTLTNLGQTVIFYPDGSTSTAEALIRNKNGDMSGVQIRGLTGHSRVLGITSSSEASRK